MSNQSYQDASEADKIHFIDCGVCGEKLDCRDLDEIFQHEDHKPHPDIQYSGSARMPESGQNVQGMAAGAAVPPLKSD